MLNQIDGLPEEQAKVWRELRRKSFEEALNYLNVQNKLRHDAIVEGLDKDYGWSLDELCLEQLRRSKADIDTSALHNKAINQSDNNLSEGKSVVIGCVVFAVFFGGLMYGLLQLPTLF